MSSISDFAMFRFNFWPKPFFSHHHAAVAAAAAASQAGTTGMENSFVPNPLNSPALMVLASTAEGHDNSARMPAPPHPFTSQNIDKEMSPHFGNPPFTMYRPGEHFPPPIYAPQFVRSNLDRSMGLMNPGGGSAFRPVSNEGVENYHSAFSPAKKPKLDESSSSYSPTDKQEHDFADSAAEGSESKASTPHIVKEERPASLSSAAYESNSETFSENGDFDRGTPDSEGRNLRKQRRKCILDGHTPCCPICGLTLRNGEVEAHYSMEIEKIDKIVRGGRHSRDTTPQGRKTLPSPLSGRRGKDSPSTEAVSQSRYDSYQRIRCNRQARLSVRSRNRKKKGPEDTVCPICNERLNGTPEELNGHVEICLKRQRGEHDNEDETVDVEGDGEQYEEYEWAGQTRIRATTMLEGGFAGSGFHVTSSKKQVDEDVDLNVDGDDSEEYGKAQYNEVHIIPCSSDEPGEDWERQAIRGAMLGETSLDLSTKGSSRIKKESEDCDMADEESSPPMLNSIEDVGGSAGEVIAALKSRLKDKEEERINKQKCLICMEQYKTPLTSIQCWHVHCEQCWLKTLGTKKLCPQCNMITSPGDLRRIYL